MLPTRVTKPEWSVYKLFGEAALNTIGKLYDYQFTSKFLQEQYESLLGTKADFNMSAVFVIREGTNCIAIIAAHLIGNVVTEVCWYVKPNYRKGTHGIKLLRALEDWGRQRKAKYISISRFKHSPKGKTGYKVYKELLLKELS